MNLKKILTLDIIETSIRIWTAYYIFIYGMSKSTQFAGAKLMDISIKDASEFQMMWAFFGTTQAYPIIIGCFQVIGGILLIFRKTKLFGALLLTPIFINIILLNIFYKIHYGALVNAMIYQSVFIFIIIQQRRKIEKIIKVLIIKNDNKTSFGISAAKFIISIILAAILFYGFQKFSIYIYN